MRKLKFRLHNLLEVTYLVSWQSQFLVPGPRVQGLHHNLTWLWPSWHRQLVNSGPYVGEGQAWCLGNMDALPLSEGLTYHRPSGSTFWMDGWGQLTETAEAGEVAKLCTQLIVLGAAAKQSFSHWEREAPWTQGPYSHCSGISPCSPSSRTECPQFTHLTRRHDVQAMRWLCFITIITVIIC